VERTPGSTGTCAWWSPATRSARPAHRRARLIVGQFLDGQEVEAIGAGAPGKAERAWRSYGQLRELAFIRNDGFPLPVVFAEFDPGLIRAQDRVDHLIGLPVGRTHYSRALREGPTWPGSWKPGAGLAPISSSAAIPKSIIARTVQAGGLLPQRHFYVDAATYARALVRHKGLSAAQAAEAAGRCIPRAFG